MKHVIPFPSIFKTLYDNNCPMKQYYRSNKYKENQWMSKGLQNACEKKNTLYAEFITKEVKGKYKKYKNKLTNIMRNCKKENCN